MKYFLFLILCITTVKSRASNILLYEKANQLYHNQMYADAAELYVQMIEEGYTSANMYYNTGNAFFKLKKAGMAIWCYEKALQIEPQFKNAKDNLLVTRTQLKITSPLSNAKPTIIQRFCNIHSINNWSIGSLIFSCVYALFFLLKKFNKNNPFFIVLRKLSLVLFFVYISMSVLTLALQKTTRFCICILPTSLSASADINDLRGIKVIEGEKLKIVDDTNPRFLKVFNGKNYGYIQNSFVKKL